MPECRVGDLKIESDLHKLLDSDARRLLIRRRNGLRADAEIFAALSTSMGPNADVLTASARL